MRFILILVSGALLLFGLSGCSDRTGGTGGLPVTATTTQVGALVRAVGGDRIDLTQILQPNADPHEYEPRPSDALALARAKVVFRSGGDVDEWLDKVVKQAAADARVVTLSDSVSTL